MAATHHHGGLSAQRMPHQRALHLGRANAVPGNVYYVIHPTRDPVVAVLVPAGAIPREVVALHAKKRKGVGLLSRYITNMLKTSVGRHPRVGGWVGG